MIVVVVVLSGSLRLGSTASSDTITASRRSSLGAPDAATGGCTGLETLKFGVLHPGHDHRDVAGALADTAGATAGTGAETLQCRTLVGVAGDDSELVGDLAVVVLSVGDCRLQNLANGGGDVALHRVKNLESGRHRLVADEVEHDAGLVGRHSCVTVLGPGTGPLVGLGSGHRRPLRSWPAWNLKVRVGANSPSL